MMYRLSNYSFLTGLFEDHKTPKHRYHNKNELIYIVYFLCRSAVEHDGSIPVGLNATLLAIGVDDDNYLRFGTLEIDVQEEDEFTIDVDYGTTENLATLINQLGE